MALTFFRITESNVLRVLALGFVLVMTLLGAAGLIAVRQSQRIRASVAQLARDQLLIARLVHDVQMEENAMTEVLHQLAQFQPKPPDHAALLRDLDESDKQLARLSSEARAAAGEALWRDLEASVKAFTHEAHRVLETGAAMPRENLESLFKHHDHVVDLVNKLVQASSDRLAAAEREIEQQSQELGDDAALLLGSSFVLAAICALLTVGFTRKSLHRIRWQSDELNRVSWHMLQTQEETARRFSHELHDELGQSLAAVRSNLTKGATRDFDSLRADCLHLVDESIANVRELSQLLRPVILDDFGLDAGLRWLTEKFGQRVRVGVEYESRLAQRLHSDTETHLFRIAQEALTNIARHSQATKVLITLEAEVAIVRLTIQDNGLGLSPDRQESPASLGLIGMQARARECGGTLDLQPVQPNGLRIVVEVPLRLAAPEA
ncbi:sensor histidine kinase [Prosthecobacter sp.]|uniref:sensor histidine kinase n=1 Tax=Prosthecobacter sp. TaxID=1965333 RepID=UPI002ABC4F96|nr:sensor histidine kinase [Prosthecobacter sp.]MDZ4403190.1 sensor histidine kinase [Prosthecobacter sp.]